MQEMNTQGLKGRSEYQARYYREHKEQIKTRYKAQKQYVGYVDVKKTLNRLKKQIGTNSYDLIMTEIDKLERAKYG